MDDREAWAKRMMAGVAAGGAIGMPAMPFVPGDDWTQEDIDRSLANEAILRKAREHYDTRITRMLESIANGHEPMPGALSDLQRDRKTMEQMATAMGEARGWRVVAKDKEVDEIAKQA